MGQPNHFTLMDKVTTNTTGDIKRSPFSTAVVHGTIDGTGAVSCTVTIEGSIRGRLFVSLGTLSLTGTTTDSKKLALTEPWPFLRATTSSITGTGATVSVDVAGV